MKCRKRCAGSARDVEVVTSIGGQSIYDKGVT